jgi:hypothetical protein
MHTHAHIHTDQPKVGFDWSKYAGAVKDAGTPTALESNATKTGNETAAEGDSGRFFDWKKYVPPTPHAKPPVSKAPAASAASQ